MAETETDDIDRDNEPLLRSLKADLPALETLLDEADSHWGFESLLPLLPPELESHGTTGPDPADCRSPPKA
jgi:hypothetical protein